MLKINDVEYNVSLATLKFVNANYNGVDGYSVLVSFDINLNDVNGYISFYVDFFDNIDFKLLENKCYVDNLNNLDSKISMLEIYDTFTFIDFVDNDIKVEFGKIEDDNINMKFNINDESLILEFEGLLELKKEMN